MNAMTSPMWDTHAHVFGDPVASPVLPHSGYVPPARKLDDWLAIARPCGIERIVLVQPSVYGTDNSLMLDAIARSGGAARGIAVVDADATPAMLAGLFAAGVRGLRFNMVSEAGNGLADYQKLAPVMVEAGLHAQFFSEARDLPSLLPLAQAAGAPRFVVDHLGLVEVGKKVVATEPGPVEDLYRLLDTGRVWVKASGFYRFGVPQAQWPQAFGPMLDALFARYPERVVWASDWPHSWFFNARDEEPPQYRDLVSLVTDRMNSALTDAVMRRNPLALYD
jgi:D-galactarolactone isomerase